VKRFLLPSLKLSVVGLLLAYHVGSLRRDRAEILRLQDVATRWEWLLLAQAFIGLSLLLAFHRLRLLLRAQGIGYGFWEAVALGFMGLFFNQFAPGATGGDIAKAYCVARDHPRRRTGGVTAVLLDRAAGLVALLFIAALGIGINWPEVASNAMLSSLALLVGAMLAGAAALSALLFSGRLRSLPSDGVLGKLRDAIDAYRSRPKLLAQMLLLSIVSQLSMVGMAVSYAEALGGGAEIGSFFYVVPLVHVALSIPVGLPGGLGQSELAYRELFDLAGYPYGLPLALLQRLNWCLWALVGGVYYLRRRGCVRRDRAVAAGATASLAPPGLSPRAMEPAST